MIHEYTRAIIIGAFQFKIRNTIFVGITEHFVQIIVLT